MEHLEELSQAAEEKMMTKVLNISSIFSILESLTVQNNYM